MSFEKKNENKTNPKQIIKKAHTTYKSKITLRESSDYGLFDEEIEEVFEDLYYQ